MKSANYWAITLTQPWATLCVAALQRPLPLLTSWKYPRAALDDDQPQAVHRSPPRPVVIPAGAPPKRHETRSFQPYASAIGKRCVMHAGKGDADMAGSVIDPATDQLREPYRSAVVACGYNPINPWSATAAELRELRVNLRVASDATRARWYAEFGGPPLPIGAAVGLVTFEAAHHTIRWWSLRDAGTSHALDYLLGNWGPGRYAWQIGQPRELLHPVPCRGFQMLWKVDDATDAAIRAQGIE